MTYLYCTSVLVISGHTLGHDQEYEAVQGPLQYQVLVQDQDLGHSQVQDLEREIDK